jgi:lipoprotein-releasing system permease protein
MNKFFYILKILRRTPKGTVQFFVVNLAVISVAIAAATIIIVSSIMNGFHNNLETRIISINSHLRIINLTSVQKAKKTLFQLKKEFPQIVSGNIYTLGAGRLIYQDRIRSIFLKGVNSTNIEIGYYLADDINLHKQQKFSLITRQGIFPITRHSRFESGFYDIDNNLVNVPFNTFFKMFIPGEYTAGLELYISKPTEAIKLAEKIRNTGYEAIPWQEVNRSLSEAMRAEKKLIQIILFFITLLASFSILSTIYLTIHEKHRTLALLRATGVSSFELIIALLTHGLRISLEGLGLGFVLSFILLNKINLISSFLKIYFKFEIFPHNVFFLNKIPVYYLKEDFIFTFLITTLITIIGSIYPTLKTSRLPLVKELKNYD